MKPQKTHGETGKVEKEPYLVKQFGCKWFLSEAARAPGIKMRGAGGSGRG